MGHNQRAFRPFNTGTDKMADSLNGIAPRSGFFKSALDYKNLLSALNKESQAATKQNRFQNGSPALKLMSLLDTVLDKLVDEKFDGIV